MKNIKIIKIGLILSVLGGLVTGCQDGADKKNTQSDKTQKKVITVKLSRQDSTLYYDGKISPIKTIVVTSPVEGRVDKKYFSYGQKIKKGEKLLEIKSPTLEKDFESAVSSFLTAKEKYTNSKGDIEGSKDLYDSGIISKQSYESAVSSLNDAYLSYLQARQSLLKVLSKVKKDKEGITLLKIGDAESVKKVLQSPLVKIDIKASAAGVALLPSASAANSGNQDAKPIHLGSEVKTGQLLLSIGEMSGIKTKVNVDEININKIEVGDKAVISSAAFPGITLNGQVVEVGKQASSNSGGGLPTFPVIVATNKIPEKARDLIHVGMSAKVQILVSSSKKIAIPIKAVKIKNDKPFVILIDPNSGKQKQQPIKTGATGLNKVNIIEGLKPGDKIVIGN